MKKRKPNKIKITFWICVIILILYLSRTSNSQTKFNEDSTQNNFGIIKQDSNEDNKSDTASALIKGVKTGDSKNILASFSIIIVSSIALFFLHKIK